MFNFRTIKGSSVFETYTTIRTMTRPCQDRNQEIKMRSYIPEIEERDTSLSRLIPAERNTSRKPN